MGEAGTSALLGGILGSRATVALLGAMAHSPQGAFFVGMQKQWIHTLAPAWILAALVGLVAAYIPAYNASRTGIVEGLRHIG
ncbi:MAG: hypothetical protein NVS1B11_22250 [Terriglobales bacterium]